MSGAGDRGGTLLSTGDTVDRFEVECLLGEGGIAQVYRVRHRRLGSLHALKLLTIDRKGLADRLILEGQIQAQLRHPNVVAVTDVVEHLGRTGLLMEYVAGKSLEHWLVSHGAPPVMRGLRLLAQVLSGVAAAHAAGVLHRDLKPANILLSETPLGVVPKVTDFGIAKLFAGDGDTGTTRQGSAMGTPGYMAPEQIEDSSGVDARADIFALGAIAYELAAGIPALRRQSLIDTFSATARGDYKQLSARDELTPATVAAIHRALSPDPSERQSSVRQFAEEIFADHDELRAVVLGAQLTGAASIRTKDTEANPTLVRKPTNPPSPTKASGTFELEPTELSAARSRPRPNLADRPPTLSPTEVDPPSSSEWQTGTGSGRAPTVDESAAEEPTPKRRPAWLPWAIGGLLATAAVAGAILTSGGPEPGVDVDPVAVPTGPAAPVAAPVAAATPTPEPLAPEVAEPTPPEASEAAPEAEPETPPEPEPVAAVEVEPEPESAPIAEPEPVAVAEPEPEAVAALDPEPDPAEAVIPDLRGTWDGRWAGRPLRLVVKGQQGDKLIGEIEIFVGSTYRTFTVSGQVSAETGQVRFWETGGSELNLRGTLTEKSMTGTLTRKGKRKPQPWNATLTRGAY